MFNVTASCVEELADDTLLEALVKDTSGEAASTVLGGAKILLRQAVAAVLNAAHPNVDYPSTVEEVINRVNSALANCDRDEMISLASELDRDNRLGCPFDPGCCDCARFCPGTDPLMVSIGDTVVYCYRVTNIGDVALYNVTLVDDMGTPNTADDILVSLGTTTLQAGESKNGTLTYVVMAGDAPRRINTATATGTPLVGGNVTDTDDCTILLLTVQWR